MVAGEPSGYLLLGLTPADPSNVSSSASQLLTVFTVPEAAVPPQLAATCLRLTSPLQSLHCELFFPATSKLPSHKRGRGKDRQQVNMTEGCSRSSTLSGTHAGTVSSSYPRGGNTNLTPPLPENVSCDCRYCLILDGSLSSGVIHSVS